MKGAFTLVSCRKLARTLSLRGRRSRNKVSVGEPAEGSFMLSTYIYLSFYISNIGRVCVCI